MKETIQHAFAVLLLTPVVLFQFGISIALLGKSFNDQDPGILLVCGLNLMVLGFFTGPTLTKSIAYFTQQSARRDDE